MDSSLSNQSEEPADITGIGEAETGPSMMGATLQGACVHVASGKHDRIPTLTHIQGVIHAMDSYTAGICDRSGRGERRGVADARMAPGAGR